MNIDDPLFKFIQQTSGDIGEIKAMQKSQNGHLYALSDKMTRIENKMEGNVDKVKSDLKEHAASLDAHGAGAVYKYRERLILGMGAAIALCGLIGPYLWELKHGRFERTDSYRDSAAQVETRDAIPIGRQMENRGYEPIRPR